MYTMNRNVGRAIIRSRGSAFPTTRKKIPTTSVAHMATRMFILALGGGLCRSIAIALPGARRGGDGGKGVPDGGKGVPDRGHVIL